MLSDAQVRDWILEGLPGATVDVESLDGVHFSASVGHPGFEGLSLMDQHRRVYNALGDHMRSDIHALALETYVPND